MPDILHGPWFLPVLLGAALAIAGVLWFWMPYLAAERAGRVLLFVALAFLPLVLLRLGAGHALGQSKTRTFCTSCHEMHDYEKSLLYDDEAFLPAVHFQKRLVPAETACYACHTDYTMYGDIEAKMNGLAHVMVHFFGDVPTTGEVELYSPYPNDNCLKCHAGSRPFEGNKDHSKGDASLEKLKSGEMSCGDKGCHDLAHKLAELGELDLWKPPGTIDASEEPLAVRPAVLEWVESRPEPAEEEGDDDLWDE